MAAGKRDFEEAMKKLEAIVEELEKGDFSLEESLEKFEEGLKLGKKCKEILDKAEARVRKLAKNGSGKIEEEYVTDEF